MMLRVASVRGVCRVIKSAFSRSSSSSTFSIPRFFARSSVKNGSYPITFIFKPWARSATIAPILPQPIMPSFLPEISAPMNLDFSHLLAVVEICACGIWRARASNMEIACSAVVTALPNGVFITTTPEAVAAAISTLSTPIPARPTTFRFGALASKSAVTLVAERIASPSYSPIIPASSSGLRPGFTSTSIPASRKISAAAGASLSLINTFVIVLSLLY